MTNRPWRSLPGSELGLMHAARYTTQLGLAAHSARPGRESLFKRLGKVARQIRERKLTIDPRTIRAQARRRLPV